MKTSPASLNVQVFFSLGVAKIRLLFTYFKIQLCLGQHALILMKYFNMNQEFLFLNAKFFEAIILS